LEHISQVEIFYYETNVKFSDFNFGFGER
jgi:hypothetical protein